MLRISFGLIDVEPVVAIYLARHFPPLTYLQ